MSGLYRGSSGLGLGTGLFSGASGLALGAGLTADVGPALSLDFLTTATIDPRVTFTRASTALRVNASGLLESVAIDAPRFEYDPNTLAARGLLIEEARTNLLEHNCDLSNAAWVKAGAPTITANAIAAPDGTVSADLLTRVATTAAYTGNHTTKAAAATEYASSVFVKQSVGNYAALRMQGTYPAFAEVRVNLATGAISTPAYTSGAFAGASASVEAWPGGFYRIQLVATTDAAATVSTFLTFNSNGAALDAADSVTNSAGYIWGVQLEAGGFATSLILTAAAAVTRAADVAKITGANFTPWWNAVEGSLLVEYALAGGQAAARTLVEMDDNSGPDRVFVGLPAAAATPQVYLSAGSVGQHSAIAGAITYGAAAQKLAASWSAAGASISSNGAAVATDVTAGTMPAVVQAGIGCAPRAGTVSTNGHIRRVTYYPQRLPNATLQTLST